LNHRACALWSITVLDSLSVLGSLFLLESLPAFESLPGFESLQVLVNQPPGEMIHENDSG
jgi:hypothetical protein